mmetsp:Transcript_29787/g.53544  ORF Transcript_29787/g.53544 Transcript_29787/m.53544 type:complete len:226 (-) Transcript_29787:127-804(-)
MDLAMALAASQLSGKVDKIDPITPTSNKTMAQYSSATDNVFTPPVPSCFRCQRKKNCHMCVMCEVVCCTTCVTFRRRPEGHICSRCCLASGQDPKAGSPCHAESTPVTTAKRFKRTGSVSASAMPSTEEDDDVDCAFKLSKAVCAWGSEEDGDGDYTPDTPTHRVAQQRAAARARGPPCQAGVPPYPRPLADIQTISDSDEDLRLIVNVAPRKRKRLHRTASPVG